MVKVAKAHTKTAKEGFKMNVCVFGASSNYIDEKYLNIAHDLGTALANAGMSLVFGGGSTGVMGAVARGAHENGGHILGVAPRFMVKFNVLYEENCTEFKFTETMAERKAYMEEHADAFVIAPGGIGTYEEFFEVFTLKQLDRHNKAIVILNAFGYYDEMLEMLNKSVKENFLSEGSLKLVKVFTEVEPIINYLKDYSAGNVNTADIRYNFTRK